MREKREETRWEAAGEKRERVERGRGVGGTNRGERREKS